MNKNIFKIFLSDIAIALIAVFLYSPGLLALRINDPDIIRAGLSIICGVGLAYAAVRVNFYNRSLAVIPVTEVDTLTDCRQAVQNLSGYRTFGSVIESVVGQIDRAEKYKQNMPAAIAMRFSEGSMSYDKFAVIVDQSLEAILVNTKSFITRVNMFNEKDYVNNHAAIDTGFYKRDDIPDDIQMEKEKLYSEAIASIKRIVGLNESILLRLEELNLKLTSLDAQTIDFDNDQVIGDIKVLIEDVKYFK